MKCYLKKLLMVFILLAGASSSFAQDEQSSSDHFIGVVHSINHSTNHFLVGDLEYRMPLNMEVKSSTNRRLSRYALKVGQQVSIKTRIDNNRAIAELVVISNIK